MAKHQQQHRVVRNGDDAFETIFDFVETTFGDIQKNRSIMSVERTIIITAHPTYIETPFEETKAETFETFAFSELPPPVQKEVVSYFASSEFLKYELPYVAGTVFRLPPKSLKMDSGGVAAGRLVLEATLSPQGSEYSLEDLQEYVRDALWKASQSKPMPGEPFGETLGEFPGRFRIYFDPTSVSVSVSPLPVTAFII